MQVDISILIVNWNTREHTLNCLDALPLGIDNESSYEVIVVDNASTDGSADALSERPISLIRNASNRGFAAAVNQAYRRSVGRFVLLLNSDVELTAGSLSTLARFLDDHPDAAGAAPLYLNPDGSPQPFHFRLPTFAMTAASGSAVFRRLLPGARRRLRTYHMLDDDFSHPLPVPQPSASCLLLRRSCLPEGSLLDERYPIFFNDVQLARSLARRGLTLWVTPDAVVVHEAHSSTRMLGGRAGSRQYVGAQIRMLQETEPPSRVRIYRAVLFLENLARLALRRPNALRRDDLRRALAGDPGPLPSRPAR